MNDGVKMLKQLNDRVTSIYAFIMAPYLSLRGSSLSRAIICLVVCPAFVCYGYNLSVAGGLLTLESFIADFPQLDTVNTVGQQQSYNSTIQGISFSKLCASDLHRY